MSINDENLDYNFFEIKDGILIDEFSDIKNTKIITDDMLYDMIMAVMVKNFKAGILKYNIFINNISDAVIDRYIFDLFNSLDKNGQEKIKRIFYSCLSNKNFLEDGDLDGFLIAKKPQFSSYDLSVLFLEDKSFDYYYRIIKEYNDEGLYIPNLENQFKYSKRSLEEYVENLDKNKYANSIDLAEKILSCIEDSRDFIVSEQDYKKYNDNNYFSGKFSVPEVLSNSSDNYENCLKNYLSNKLNTLKDNSNFLNGIEQNKKI